MSQRKSGGRRSFDLPGISGYMELGIRFCLWAQKLGRTPSVDEVEKKYGVPRRTAYVWIRRWKDANGMYE